MTLVVLLCTNMSSDVRSTAQVPLIYGGPSKWSDPPCVLTDSKSEEWKSISQKRDGIHHFTERYYGLDLQGGSDNRPMK